jgi:peptide-methionine (R)-S-oxide reductase
VDTDMNKPRTLLSCIALAICLANCGDTQGTYNPRPSTDRPKDRASGEILTTEGLPNMSDNISKSEAEWCKALTPEQYRVLRKKGTEAAFTGAYWNTHTPGSYQCAACGQILFDSRNKFDSGTGWPSFTQPVDNDKVTTHTDTSFGMTRTEVLCARCGSHLGHVFDDGPAPGGQRYCINSISLVLVTDDKETTAGK